MKSMILFSAVLLVLICSNGSAFPTTPLLANMGDTGFLVIPDARPEGTWQHGYDILVYSGMVYNPFKHSVIAFGGGHATNTFPVAVPEFDIQTLTWHYIVDEVGCGPLSDPANLWYNSSNQRVGGYFYNGKHYAGSQHTYDGLVMAADSDLFINVCTGMYGAAKPYCISESDWSQLTGGGSIFLLDRANHEWKATENTSLSVGHPMSAVNPLEPDWVYCSSGDNSAFYKINFKTGQRITLARKPAYTVDQSMEYYAPEHCFFSFPDNRIFKYDIASNTWSQLNTSGTAPSCYGRNVVYDTLNKVFAVFSGNDAGCAFCYFSPVERRWYRINRTYPTGRVLFHHHVYDPVNNVHILCSQAPDYYWQTLAFKLSDTPGKFPGTGINPPVTAARPALSAGRGMGVTASPNPFNASVNINYELQIMNYELKKVRLAIYDINGRAVTDFSDKIHNSSFAICNSFSWDASGLPSGIYLLKATVAGKTLTKRLFLQK